MLSIFTDWPGTEVLLCSSLLLKAFSYSTTLSLMLTLKFSQEACKVVKHAMLGIATTQEYAWRKNEYMLTIQPQQYETNYTCS